MLPSNGFFNKLPCPFFASGLCERPHCHYSHERKGDSLLGLHHANPVQPADQPSQLLQYVNDALRRVKQDMAQVSSLGYVPTPVVARPPAPQPKRYIPAQSVPQYRPTPLAELRRRRLLAARPPTQPKSVAPVAPPAKPIKQPTSPDLSSDSSSQVNGSGATDDDDADLVQEEVDAIVRLKDKRHGGQDGSLPKLSFQAKAAGDAARDGDKALKETVKKDPSEKENEEVKEEVKEAEECEAGRVKEEGGKVANGEVAERAQKEDSSSGHHSGPPSDSKGHSSSKHHSSTKHSSSKTSHSKHSSSKHSSSKHSSKERSSKESSSKESSSKESSSKESSSKESSSKESSSKESSSKEPSSKESSSKKSSSKESSTKKPSSSSKGSYKESSSSSSKGSKESSSKLSSSKGSSAKESSCKDSPSKDSPSKGSSPEEISLKESSSKESPSKEASPNDSLPKELSKESQTKSPSNDSSSKAASKPHSKESSDRHSSSKHSSSKHSSKHSSSKSSSSHHSSSRHSPSKHTSSKHSSHHSSSKHSSSSSRHSSSNHSSSKHSSSKHSSSDKSSKRPSSSSATDHSSSKKRKEGESKSSHHSSSKGSSSHKHGSSSSSSSRKKEASTKESDKREAKSTSSESEASSSDTSSCQDRGSDGGKVDDKVKEDVTTEAPSFELEWDLDSEEEEDTVEECLRIFNEASEPSSTPVTSTQERVHAKRAAEPSLEPAVPAKKRAAHNPDLARRPSAPQGLLAHVSAAQAMHNRFAQLHQRFQAAGQGRVAPVANAPLLAAARRSALAQLPQGTRTAAHVVATQPKGTPRVAHVPAIVLSKRPTIPAEYGSRVPTAVRQRYLNLFLDECAKCCSTEDEAIEKALSEEKQTYDRSSSKTVYLNVAVNTLKRLRREAAQDGGASSAGSGASGTGAAATVPAVPAQPTNRVVSHEMVLQGARAARTSFSIEKNRYRKPPPELTESRLYELLEVYRMTPEQLVEYNYPRPHPAEPGRAVFSGTDGRQYSKSNGSVLRCSRCGATFSLTEDGDYVRPEECVHHWGRLWKKRIAGALESRYSCCEGDGESDGCCVAKGHVHEGPEPSQLTGFVSTLAKSPPPGGGCPGVYSLDCEMCYTSEGVELTRVTVVGWDLQPVYETLVKPRGKILDYNTRFSGLSEEDMVGVKTSLRDVQAALLARFSADTILMGHSLDSDLRALRLIHGTVVDTAAVFPHRRGLPYKRALRTLMAEHLSKIIQNGVEGHDSQEDAAACMELMLWKVRDDLKKGVR